MPRWVFDIEGNGLLHTVSTVWIIAAWDLDKEEMRYWLPHDGDDGWKEAFDSAEMLVGHNIIGYDLPALEKVYGWRPRPGTKIRDTLTMSLVLDYRRFDSGRHRLEDWGRALGYRKMDFSDWGRYSEEMKTYCLRDVELNVKVYRQLERELSSLVARTGNKKILWHIRSEQAASRWCTQASQHGWPFDVASGKRLLAELEVAMNRAYEALLPKLGHKVVAVDKKNGVVETKRPKWTKQGFYDKFTADWFDIDPCSGYEGEERPIAGEYCRIRIEPLSLDSTQDVKLFLDRNGWVPTEYNYRVKNGKKVRTSPKITDDSLEILGGDGKLYPEFLTAKSRHGVLKGWLDHVDENGMLHGDTFSIGTPSMRARHSVIVNVPSADSPWGKEMRSLFVSRPGWKLIGCDSSGNQARGLAHFLKNEDFITNLLHGDIHQYNADVLTGVLNEMGIQHSVPRSAAKRVLYAFLFGASGGKLWSYVFGSVEEKRGNELKKGFLKAVPGFEDLLEKLKKIFSKTKQYGPGYIPSISGNRIYVDSYHKLLVYLLQSTEKITCAAALMLTAEQLEAEGIPYVPCIFMHDEIDFMVPEEHSERAAKIGRAAFAAGPKLFGIDIMDGEAKIGDNWYEVH